MELKEGLQIIGEQITDEEINELIQIIDDNNDGYIRYEGRTILRVHFTGKLG